MTGRASRGSAAVEMLLAMPFLILFLLLTFDFVKMYRERAALQTTVRRAAWEEARRGSTDADAAAFGPFTRAEVGGTNAPTGFDTFEVEEEQLTLDLDTDFAGANPFVWPNTPMAVVQDAASGHEQWMGGTVTVERAMASRRVPGLSRYFAGTSKRAWHRVALLTGATSEQEGATTGWVDLAEWTWSLMTDYVPELEVVAPESQP